MSLWNAGMHLHLRGAPLTFIMDEANNTATTMHRLFIYGLQLNRGNQGADQTRTELALTSIRPSH
eukprot:3386722-Amphidinium_carterae.1